MTDKKTFGSFIKEKRAAKNYSQKDLAELLSVTEGAVSKWERGISYPDITMISDICHVLDISEHEFITASTDTKTRRLQQEARQFRMIRNAWFWVPTGCYAVALLTCLICNLAIDGRLTWFFIVLAALLTAYSFVPTFTSFFPKHKLFSFFATSFLSVCLLLFTCAVYSGSMYWVPTACISVLIGYSAAFFPILLSKGSLSRFRFVITAASMFVLTVILLLCIYTWNSFSLTAAVGITSYAFMPLLISTAICSLRFDGFLKAGICTLLSTVMYYGIDDVINTLLGLTGNQYQINFQNWEQCSSGNVKFLCLCFFLCLGVAFLGIGIHRTRQNKFH